jgi:hypothetical protein
MNYSVHTSARIFRIEEIYKKTCSYNQFHVCHLITICLLLHSISAIAVSLFLQR